MHCTPRIMLLSESFFFFFFFFFFFSFFSFKDDLFGVALSVKMEENHEVLPIHLKGKL